MSDPVAVRTLIARFVTETCQAARKRERDRIIKDEEECKREAEIAAARALASTLVLQSSPRNMRKPPPPPALPPRQTFQRVPSSSDSETASTASVHTVERAAVVFGTSFRADQRPEPLLDNPFGDGEVGEGENKRRGAAEAVLARGKYPPRGTRVTGGDDQSLPHGDDDNDAEDEEYIDEEFECDQQEDLSDTDEAWGGPSMEEKELTNESDTATAQRWRQKGYGVDRYGDRDRDRDKGSNTGNPFGDSDSDD